MSKFTIEGIVPIIPTPFTVEEEPDLGSLRTLVDFAIGAGAAAICLPAYASEFYKLTEEERREVVEVAVLHAAGRIPVIAQVNYPSTYQSIRAVRIAQQNGASAVCCAVPRIFVLAEGDLYRHFDRILQATDLPMVIQDFNPGGSSLSSRFVAELHRAHPHFRYIKLEEPLMASKVQDILQQSAGEVGVLEGWGGMFMLELIPAGISGVMPGLAVSDILARAFHLAKSGDSGPAYELFQGVLPQIVFCLQNLELYHHAEKLLLEARGVLPGTRVRQPNYTLSKNEETHLQFLNAKILDLLDRIGLPRNPASKAVANSGSRQSAGQVAHR